MSRREWIRLLLAMAIAPNVPILALSMPAWLETGSTFGFRFFYLFGYLTFFLFGLPAIGILLTRKTWLSCAVAGGCVTILPVVLLGLLSFFGMGSALTTETLVGLAPLFAWGSLGGLVFWLIAFAKARPSAD
jgi:hypothetical protein